MVDISLDSYDAAIHDQIRGKVGAFQETMETIRSLAGFNLRPHINVTIRPDNYRGLHRMIPLLAGDIDSISFNLVDTGMHRDEAVKFIFSAKQLESFYFDELILILKECIKHRTKVRITPFFEELIGKSALYVFKKFLSAKDEYRGRFRTMFLLHQHKCAIPQSYLRINPSGNLAFCCFHDDEESPWGNVIGQDLCAIVVSDEFFNFIHNAIEGKGRCRICKQSYNANYGGNN